MQLPHICIHKYVAMLHFISWSQFGYWITITLIVYYLIVGSLFFRSELVNLVNRPPKHQGLEDRNSPIVQEPSPTHLAMQPEIPFAQVHDLLENLKAVFNQIAHAGSTKDALIDAVAAKLKPLPELNNSDMREDIDMHIKLEAKDKCKIDLSDEDLQEIWKS